MAESQAEGRIAAQADAWAAEHRGLLEACFESFSKSGEWPTIEELEHRFEIEGEEIDVGRVAWQMPRLLGFVEQGRLVLLCRALLHVAAAKPLLDAWFRAVQLCYRSWVEDPRSELISDEIVDLVEGDARMARLVSKLMLREGWMFGSGSGDPDGYWTREIISAVRIAGKANDARGLLEARVRDEPPAALPLPLFDEEVETQMPLAVPVPAEPADQRPVDKPGLARRAWRYVSGNNYLSAVAAALTLVVLGAGWVVVKGALDSAGSSPEPDGPAIAERAGDGGARTFRVPGELVDEGPRVRPNRKVEVLCKVLAPHPASVRPDGYWYRLGSQPWRGRFFAPANSFWNGDVPGQTPYTHNTDFSVPDCR